LLCRITYKRSMRGDLRLIANGCREDVLNHWLDRQTFAGCNEGRGSELSRRLTFLVLFAPDGRPGMWLMLVAGLWALVAATTLGGLG
jgi:hypothetical protein